MSMILAPNGRHPAYPRYLQSGQQPDSATLQAAEAVVVNNATRTAAKAISLLRIILLAREGEGGASTHALTVRRSGGFKVKR
jgi:hypothetical protein